MSIRERGARPRTSEVVEFRLIYASVFTVFFFAAVGSRFTLRRAGERRSILAEARAAARNYTPMVFMG